MGQGTCGLGPIPPQGTYGLGPQGTYGLGPQGTYGLGPQGTYGLGPQGTYGLGPQGTCGLGPIPPQGTYGLGPQGTYGLGPQGTYGLGPIPPQGTYGLGPIPPQGTYGLGPQGTCGLGPIPPQGTYGLGPIPPQGTYGLGPQGTYGLGPQGTCGLGPIPPQGTYGLGPQGTYGLGPQGTYGLGPIPPQGTYGLGPIPPQGTYGLGPQGTCGLGPIPPQGTYGLGPIPPQVTYGLGPQGTYGLGPQGTYGLGPIPPQVTYGLGPQGTYGLGPQGTYGLGPIPPQGTYGLGPIPQGTYGLGPIPPQGTYGLGPQGTYGLGPIPPQGTYGLGPQGTCGLGPIPPQGTYGLGPIQCVKMKGALCTALNIHIHMYMTYTHIHTSTHPHMHDTSAHMHTYMTLIHTSTHICTWLLVVSLNAFPESHHIIENNLEVILRLLWHLVWYYQISATTDEQFARKLLLGWVNSSVPSMATYNFTTDWSSGVRLSALVDHCQPGLIPDYASLDPHNALQNIENAMSLAEKHLNIPRVLQSEDLAVPKPDELSVMTYISYFCQPGSVGRYRLLNWVNQRIPKSVSNFTTDWVDGCALGALTDAVSGGGFAEHKVMKPRNALDNCRSSMDAATRLLSVQPIITPEEFSNQNLDRVLRITYLNQFLYSTCYLSTPGTVTAAGPGITGALCGSETSFEVKARLSAKTQLQVSVVAPTGSLIPVSHQSGIGTHTYTYKPDNPGVYSVQVKLGGEHVTGSPFKARHSSPFTLTRCIAEGPGLTAGRVGEEAQFAVNCETGVPGELQVRVRGPSGSVATGIHSPKEKNFLVKFTPYEVGIHTIAVLWGNKDLNGSPFECNVTDPTRCVVSGAGLKSALVGQPQQFVVKAEKAGQGVLTVEGKGLGGAVVPVAIAEEGLGTYRCTYTLRERGDYNIHVWWSAVPIPGSPFAVRTVLPADATKCRVIGLPSGWLQVGKSYGFTVDAGDTGAAELVVSTSGVVKCQVTETEKGQHYVTFTPNSIGVIQLVPTFARIPVPGSPFEFRVNNPSKCSVDGTSLMSATHYINRPIDFLVSAQQAGEGEVTVVVQTLQSMVEVEVRRQDDGNFLCRYLPQTEGPQALNVYFDKTPIPDMPVWLFVQPGFALDKIVITQPVPGRFGSFIIDQPYDYHVLTPGVVPAKLSASGMGVFTRTELTLSVVEVDRDEYKVTMEATRPDQYVVNIRWGEEDVPGSPFLIKVEDRPFADSVVVEGPHYLLGSSEPVRLAINAEKAGAGELKVTCHGEKAGAVPVDVQQLHPKTFQASFGAKEPDVYTIKVLWADFAIPGSPFIVDTTPPDASKCIVIGPTVPLETFKPVELIVDATSAGSGKLVAEAGVGKTTGAAGSIDIKEMSQGRHTVFLHTTTPDIYTLAVKWAGQHVGKSPYTLNLHPPIPTAVTIAQAPTQTVDTGQSISISFNTKKAGRGSLVATCVGNKVGEVPTKTTEREGSSIWDVKLTPPEPDVYFLSVKWARQNIRGSPFKINLMPISIEKVKVVGPTQPRGLGSPVELQIITREAGKGKVVGKVTCSNVGVIPVQIVEAEQDVFLVTFNPPIMDVYSFEVLFGGQHVRGSPFCVNTLFPDATKVVTVQTVAAELTKAVSFSCDTSQAGSGVLTSSCHGDKHGSVQVDVTKADSGHYTVSFTPSVPDLYNLRVEWSGTEVKGSPFIINLLPVVPYKVGVGEVHVPSTIGRGEVVYVDLDYRHVGQGSTTAVVKGNLVGLVPVDVDTVSVFVRRVKFIPRMADVYHLSIQFGEGHVSGSPFVINLLPAQSEKVCLLELMTPFGTIGPVSFLFDTSKAGKGTMSMQASGSAVGPVGSQVRVVGPGRCKAWFTASKPDTYKVDVKWDDISVQNFPFNVSLLPPCYPERVVCGDPVFRAVGKPVVTAIDVSNAGKGNLHAQCLGRKSGLVNVEVEMESATMYKVRFVPDVEDIYDLKIFCDDKEVSGSPIMINLVPIKEEIELLMVEEYTWLVTIPPEYVQIVTDSHQSAPIHPVSSLSPATSLSDLHQQPTSPLRLPQASPSLPRPSSSLPQASSSLSRPSSLLHVSSALPHASSSLPRPSSALPQASSSLTTASSALPHLHPRSPSPLPRNAHTSLPSHPVSFLLYSPSSTPSIPPPPHPTTPLPLNVGEALKILLQSDGESDLEVETSAIGDETGLTDVKVSDNSDGTVSVVFIPDGADNYTVSVLLNGVHIPYSPFAISSSSQVNPEKCIIFGLKEAAANPTVDQELKFGVNASKAGEGALDVRCEGPSEDGYPSELEVYRGEQPGVSHIVYIPTAPGVHRIYLTWSDAPIPGSPVVFNVQDTEQHQEVIYPVGKKASQEIAIDCKLSELTAHCTHKETGNEQKVKIRKVANGLFKFKIIPKTTGTYRMHISVRGKEISQSPLKMKVGPAPDPGAVVVQNCPKTVHVEHPVCFTVDASRGGAGSLTVKVATPKGATDCPVTTKCRAQVYTVTFVPTNVGDYTIALSWANCPLSGGPYVVSVKDKEFGVHTAMVSGTNFVLLNHPVGIQLLKLPPDYKVEAQAVGITVHETLLVDADSQPDQCYVSFQPTKSDRYSLQVKVNGSHVAGSPFRIVVVDPSSLVPDGGGLHPALMPLLGQPVNLILPLTASKDDDTAQVIAVTESPSGPLPTSTNSTVDSVVAFSFTPAEPGLHLMQVTHGETPLHNSPFAIPVSPWCSDCHLLKEDLDTFSKVWPLTPGLLVSFRVSSELAGEGILNASVGESPARDSNGPAKDGKGPVKDGKGPAKDGKGPAKDGKGPAKDADIKVEDSNNGTHTCTIAPWAVGRYTINVLWNGEHIDGSPFVLNIKSADVITGLNLQDEKYIVGVPHSMIINCDFPEYGKFELLCKPTSGAEIHVDPIPGRNAYKCEITPQLPGPHELNVLYNGDHILGSPFFVEFENMCGALHCVLVSSSAEQHEVGHPVDFVISTKGAGKGTLTSEVQNVTTGAVFPVTVEPLSEGDSYRLQFTPGQSNEYLLTVMFDGRHIVGSPFNLVFAEPQATDHCRIEGEGLAIAFVDKTNSFLVFTGEDDLSRELQVLIQGDNNMKGPHTIKRNSSTYEILYTPSREGKVQVDIKWGGEQIQGSPFVVPCCRHSDPTLFSIAAIPAQTTAGRDTLLKVTTKQNTHNGVLTITARSSSGKIVNGTTRALTKQEYECILPPMDVGNQEVSVLWNRRDIQGSPFNLTVLDNPLLDKVVVEGEGLTHGLVGQECEFIVDTSNGGVGTLAIRLQGPKGAVKFNMTKHTHNNRKIVVTYSPLEEGTHKIDVLWSGVPVQGSPFLASITP